MSKTYLSYELRPEQLLLPAALQEWLPDDHLAYFIIRRGGPVGHIGGHRSLRAGTAWRAAVSSTDDGQGDCSTATAWGWRPHAASPSVSTRTSPSGCWRRTTHRTSGPSPTFAKIMWMRCRACSYRYWRCVSTGLVKLGHVALDGTKVQGQRIEA